MPHSKSQQHDRSALILFGSETGNSEDAAEQLSRITERLRFQTIVAAMDTIGLDELSRFTIVIFVISTTGQGEFANNARAFWKSLLRKRLQPDHLSHVSFTTFGFGDSSYVKFNHAARKLHKRLCQLGAHEFFQRGEGDEQHDEGADGALIPWSYNLRKILLERYALPEGSLPIPDTEPLPPKCILQIDEMPHTPPYETQLSSQNQDRLCTTDLEAKSSCLKALDIDDKPYSREQPSTFSGLLPIKNAHRAEVVQNKRITPDSHWQDVRHLILSVPESVPYGPGDTVTIHPKNFSTDVEALIRLQNWTEFADKPLHIVPRHNPEGLPLHTSPLYTLACTSPCTLRSLLLHNLDITAIPRRRFFEEIAWHTTDQMHRERLLEFSNPVFSDEFFDYTSRPRRSILEVLQDFPTVQIPFQLAIIFFPLVRGRQFSVASAGLLKQNPTRPSGYTQIELLVALVKYRTVLKKIRQGLCSRYLESLQPGSQINITLQTGSFPSMTSIFEKPIVMVAPGTGLAPMRSLIWERASRKSVEQKPIEKAALIFGNRNRHADFFFEEEWKHGQDLVIFTAFSRDQREKHFVQDVVHEQGQLIYDLLKSKGGTVFVCGSSGKMPVAVRQAIVDAFLQWGQVDEETAQGWLAQMEKENRYVQETW